MTIKCVPFLLLFCFIFLFFFSLHPFGVFKLKKKKKKTHNNEALASEKVENCFETKQEFGSLEC